MEMKQGSDWRENPQLFASLFVNEVPTIQIPQGHYDPEQQVYVDADTKQPMWLGSGEQTTCTRAAGLKSEMNTYCAATDKDGNCTNTVEKLDFSTDYIYVKDAL